MKILRIVLTFIFTSIMLMTAGCSVRTSAVKKALAAELDYLKSLDSDQEFSIMSYKELFPNADGLESTAIRDIFVLFFKDFDYKIQQITLDEKSDKALVSVNLTTLDAASLAKDFAAHSLKIQIESAAGHSSQSLETLDEHCRLLNHLLKTNEYEVSTSVCQIPMIKTENSWEIQRSVAVENDLTGGLITCLSDPFILTPEETMDVYLSAIKQMNLPELRRFFMLDSLFDDIDDPAKSEIAGALTGQIIKTFDYQILGAETKLFESTVNIRITTFDGDAIIAACKDELSEYMNSPEAVLDGYSGRYEKSLELLLSHISANEKTIQKDVVIGLINDGISWKPESPEQSLGPAVFGALNGSVLS